jgi:hypothetical protein
LSHDGKWIAYTSDVSGIDEIYVRPFDGAPAGQSGGRLVSQGGGSYARWSRDGKQLFYLSSGQELNSVAVNRQGTDISFDAPRALFELPEIFAFVGAYPYDVTSDGKRFLVTREPLDAPTKVIQVITNVAEDMSRKSAN